MRDILLVALVFASLPFILKRPYIGILVWSWLGYMNPQRLTWSFAYNMPFAQIVALTLLFSLLFTKEKKTIPINTTTVIWIIFLLWMTLTTILAIYPDRALEFYIRVIKIQAITFLTLMLITNPRRIDLLIWVIALSIGFYSIKGGIFTILTGGQFRVYGPSQSMIGENNALALATLMIIPLFFYLYKTSTNINAKRFLLGCLLLSLISVLGSQSRGALLGICAVGGYFWWQSSSKLFSGLAVLILAMIGFTFMPQSWHERMATIQNYEQDPSAMSRIYAWNYSINLANDKFTGGGLVSWSEQTYKKYEPRATGYFVAHSIYFNVLADHGWTGLILYLLILFLTWQNLSWVIKQTRGDPSHHFHILAKMIKVSLIAFFSGGAFLSLSYFDLPWHLTALSVLMREILNKNPDISTSPETATSEARKQKRIMFNENIG